MCCSRWCLCAYAVVGGGVCICAVVDVVVCVHVL